MPAIIEINEKNGAGEVATAKRNLTVRFKAADNSAVDNNAPLVVPASGSIFSFQKILRMNLSGTYTQISNLAFYTDGANGYGTGVFGWAKAVGAYVAPILEVASAGYTDVFTFTQGSPLAMGTGPYTADGDVGSYLVAVLEVLSTASQGALTGEVWTFSWDEI